MTWRRPASLQIGQMWPLGHGLASCACTAMQRAGTMIATIAKRMTPSAPRLYAAIAAVVRRASLRTKKNAPADSLAFVWLDPRITPCCKNACWIHSMIWQEQTKLSEERVLYGQSSHLGNGAGRTGLLGKNRRPELGAI
jgi:hypothetical protein